MQLAFRPAGTRYACCCPVAGSLTTTRYSGDPTTDPTKSPIGKYIGTSGGTTGINGGAGTSSAPIYVPDLSASNGVAHVVGKILFPN